MSDETQNKLPPTFDLIVGPADGIIDNADVPVRWCVNSDMIADFERQGIINPVVILYTCDINGQNEWRGAAPLTDMIMYARFYRAGKQSLNGMIVDAGTTPEEVKEYIRNIQVKEYGQFTTTYQTHGEPVRSREKYLATAWDTVVIPDGVFGREPRPWTKWFVNLWHEGSTEDQCQFRRRAIMAFTLKWIPVTVWSLFYVLVANAVQWGVKGLGLYSWVGPAEKEHTFHPFNGSLNRIVDSNEGKYGNLNDSQFLIRIPWKNTVHQPLYSMLFLTPTMVSVFFLLNLFVSFMNGAPNIWMDAHIGMSHAITNLWGIFATIDLFTAAYYVNNSYKQTKNVDTGSMFIAGFVTVAVSGATYIFWKEAESGVFISIMILFTLLIIGAILAANKTDVFNWYIGLMDKLAIWLDEKFGRVEYGEVRELLCPKDLENLSTDIKSLPKNRISWRLSYRNIKAKVCKPMQR